MFDAADESLDRLVDEFVRHEAICNLWSGYLDTVPHPASAEDVSQTIVDFLVNKTARLFSFEPGDTSLRMRISEVTKLISPKSIGWLMQVIRARVELFREGGGESDSAVVHTTDIVPDAEEIALYAVETLRERDPSAEEREALNTLLSLGDVHDAVAHSLPGLFAVLDPVGRAVPALVASRLREGFLDADVHRYGLMASVAASYSIGGEAWRTIAVAACVRANAWIDEKRLHVYYCLASRRKGSWSGTPGRLHPRFQLAIDQASRTLAAETHEALKPFWAWRLSNAEAAKKLEQELIEEREI